MDDTECLCVDATIGNPAPLVFHTVDCNGADSVSPEEFEKLATCGRHWKDVMVDLGALVISTLPSGRVMVRGVSRRAAREHSHPLVENDRVWTLHPHEQILGIDVCFGRGSGLAGVRLITNERESAWYGSCVATKTRRFLVPSHFFINGVFSSMIDGCVIQFGVRQEPKDRHFHSTACCDRDEELAQSSRCGLILSSEHSECHNPNLEPFQMSHYHLRAVSVRWSKADGWVDRIDILTKNQYRRLLAANRDGRPMAILEDHEDMTVLCEDCDEVTKLEVAFARCSLVDGEHSVVVGLRLTTRRGGEQPWLGSWKQQASTNDIVMVQTHDKRDAAKKLTGFGGAYNAQGALVYLHPLYHRRLPDDDS